MSNLEFVSKAIEKGASVRVLDHLHENIIIIIIIIIINRWPTGPSEGLYGKE